MADEQTLPKKGLIATPEAWDDTKAILDALVARQATEGERAGSFHATAAPTAAYEYTAPLALLSATERPEITPEDKARYLASVKSWLTFTEAQQRDGGPLDPGSPKLETEGAIGALWVSSRYKQATDSHPDKASLQAIAADNPEALQQIADRASLALENLQKKRSDNLLPATAGYMPSYLFINVHARGALLAAQDCFGPESDIGKRCATVGKNLAEPLKEFAYPEQEHAAFQKNSTSKDSFVIIDGHELSADGYIGIFAGQNKHLKSARKEFEAAMSDPDKKAAYFRTQTLPYATVMGLSAAGVETVKINGQDIPLPQIMASQLKALRPDSEQPHVEYVHSLAGTCLTAFQGHEWIAPASRDQVKGPAKSQEKPAEAEAPQVPPPPSLPETVDMNDVMPPVLPRLNTPKPGMVKPTAPMR